MTFEVCSLNYAIRGTELSIREYYLIPNSSVCQEYNPNGSILSWELERNWRAHFYVLFKIAVVETKSYNSMDF